MSLFQSPCERTCSRSRRTRQLDSPPRIWAPYDLSRKQKSPCDAHEETMISPAAMTPSPPEPAIAIVRSVVRSRPLIGGRTAVWTLYTLCLLRGLPSREARLSSLSPFRP